MSKQYLLIFGASGLTGTEIIRQTAASDVNVRVTYREQAELNTLRNYGVEPFYADYEKPDTICQAMVGIDRLIAIMPVHPNFEEWGKLIIDCAKDVGIKRFVALSNFAVDKEGASASIIYMHHQLEKHLIESSIPYTIIRPSLYFQNLFWTTLTIVRQKSFSLPMENAKIPHIDMRDVADALLATALDDKKHLNKTYTLTGTQLFSMFDISRLLSKAIGQTIRYYPAPLTAATDSFRDMGMTNSIAHAVAEVYKDYVTLDLTAINDDFKKICGRPPRSLETFIQEHADIFAGNT